MAKDSFSFKQFVVNQDICGMKVGTDGVLLGAWATGGGRVLDIGTGTGLIAMMMAQRFPNAYIDAIDIDENAYRQALSNVSQSNFSDRISIFNTRLQDFFPEQKYDCIVSNPPYFNDSLRCPDKQRATARHNDTLSFVDLLHGVCRLLTDDGVVNVVLSIERLDDFIAEAMIVQLYETRRCMIKTTTNKPPKRVLLTLAKHRAAERESSIEILNDADGQRTRWYDELTKDFYIK